MNKEKQREYDLKRKNNPQRIIYMKIRNIRTSFAKQIRTRLNWLLIAKTPAELQKRYRESHRKINNLRDKAYRLRKKGLKPLQIIIDKKTIDLPFLSLARPSTTTSVDYEKWKQDLKDFEYIKEYYNN